MHLFPGMIQDPSRAVLAPCCPFPLRGKWSVRTQGGFGMVGSLRCPLDGFDCINISALCVYIYMWIHLSASLGHVDAGHRSLIARRYRSSLPGRKVERPHSWSWGPDRRRSETWHRASTCPSSSTYALKYSIPVITYLSVKRQGT